MAKSAGDLNGKGFQKPICEISHMINRVVHVEAIASAVPRKDDFE